MGTLTIISVDTAADSFTTSSPHRLTSGDDVRLVATSAPGGLVNNTVYYARVLTTTTFAVHPSTSVALTITAATCTANVATLTFATQASSPFTVGSTIRVQGITGQTSYNGSFTVTGCTTTTVTYALPTVAAGTTSGDPTPTVRAHTRSMARTGFGTIDITSAGTSVTFQTIDTPNLNLITSQSYFYSTLPITTTSLITIAIPFTDYRVEPRYVATTSVLGTAQIDNDYIPMLAPMATALNVISIPFSDYRVEPRYVATTSILGTAQIENDALSVQVSAVGLITSPTYVYTDGAPKAAPGPAIVTEVWYLS